MQASKSNTPAVAPAPAVVARETTKVTAKATQKPAGKSAAKNSIVAAGPKKQASKPAVVKKVAKATALPASKPVAEKQLKDKKIKMVRDSIAIPKTEYLVLDEMKLRAGKLEVQIKKTELIRAGIKLLAALPDAAFQAALRAVPNLKTGRPSKSA